MKSIEGLKSRLIIDGLITNFDIAEMLDVTIQTADKICRQAKAKKVCNGRYVISLEDFKQYLGNKS
jgi:DNA-binding CsgD family transcriptional regulator